MTGFRAFIARGNVLDLAVAVIIGAAFGAIVNSLAEDLIMPAIGAVSGGLDFSRYFILLGQVRQFALAQQFAGGQGSVSVTAWNLLTCCALIAIMAQMGSFVPAS